jgi:hypothetical protein
MKLKSCFGILFGLSLIAGIFIGNEIKIVITGGTETPTPTVTPTPFPEENDTILFVGVDDLQAETALLEGAWLATLCNKPDHPDDDIHIILITLYPIIPDHVKSVDQTDYTKPHDPIPIYPDNFDSFREIKPIFNTDENWAHVIIVDEYAMNLIISLINPKWEITPEPPNEDTFLKAWENPIGTYQQHSAILKTLCEEPESYAVLNNVQEITNLNNTHLRTTLTNDGLIGLWQLVNYSLGKTVSCEFYP